MRNRVLLLAAFELLLAAGGLWTIGRQGIAPGRPGWGLFLGYTAVVTALVMLPRVYLEYRRHASWITPADCATLIGLFALGPMAFVIAAMLAELAGAAKLRQPGLKKVFNLVHMFGGFVVGATTFALLGRTDPLDPLAWACGVVALIGVAAWDALSTSVVLAIAEQQRLTMMLRSVVPAVAFSFVLSALLGLAALLLFEVSPFGPLLFAPVLGILIVSTRGVAQQRSERMRFERLYGASSRLARLVSLPDILAMVADEAKGLMTGASAICCTEGPDGSWTGMVVDDQGPAPASKAVVAAVRGITSDGPHGETSYHEIPRGARGVLTTCASIVWAAERMDEGGDFAGRVVVAVLRDLPRDEMKRHRADVLGAFVAHAATVVANVGLHQEVQRALERQLRLNQQKTEFVASVSHELRTPLAAMIGSVQTMKRLGDRIGDEERLRMLDMGLSQGARLRSLIEDLLLVAAADHDDAVMASEAFDLTELLGDVLDEFSVVAEGRVRVHVDEDVGVFTSDRGKLRRIITNLVENARKYAPEGPIVVAASRGPGRVFIAVSDHGPGIPAEERERVFERFVQLDQSSTRQQGGTGLGLFLCRQLAGLLGGEISVRPSASGGACFTISLPDTVDLTRAPAAAADRRLPAGMAASPLKRPVAASPLAPPRGVRKAPLQRSKELPLPTTTSNH